MIKVGDVIVYQYGTESETSKKEYWLVLDIIDRNWSAPSGGRRVNLQLLLEQDPAFNEQNINIALDRIYDKKNLASDRTMIWYVL